MRGEASPQVAYSGVGYSADSYAGDSYTGGKGDTRRFRVQSTRPEARSDQ
jgi:hypothetical protein